jgi:DNA-binding transcriptional MerR regulator
MTFEEPVLDKAPDAFRTISEVAGELDIPQHVLRFWETRFSQIKPMKRSGGRRFYRPDDVDLLRGIRRLLYGEGYTIRGVQRILKEQGIKSVQALSDIARAVPSLYGLDDGVKTKIARDDLDQDATHLDDAQDESTVLKPVALSPTPAPPPRRSMATPLPRMELPLLDIAPHVEAAGLDDDVPNSAQRIEPVLRPATSPSGQAASYAPNARASAAVPPKPDRRPLDIIRLKTVMSDLIVCREMLDRALQDS